MTQEQKDQLLEEMCAELIDIICANEGNNKTLQDMIDELLQDNQERKEVWETLSVEFANFLKPYITKDEFHKLK